MTDLERRALLGDAEAQRECTEKGMVLPCTHGAECRVFDVEVEGRTAYRVISMKCCCFQGPARLTKKDAISDWNMRPAPPIGRCGECAYWDKNTGECAAAADTEVAYHKYTDPDFFCGDFKPKGGEEDAKSGV